MDMCVQGVVKREYMYVFAQGTFSQPLCVSHNLIVFSTWREGWVR